MTETKRYSVQPGRKYDRIVSPNGEGFQAEGFIDRATGVWYTAKAWGQRGRMMTREHRAVIEPNLTREA